MWEGNPPHLIPKGEAGMAILKETYSAKYVLDKLDALKREWQTKDSMMKKEINEKNHEMMMMDRMTKINNVRTTNPQYIQAYNEMQELIEKRNEHSRNIGRMNDTIGRLVEKQNQPAHKNEFNELKIELTMAERVLYGFDEESDLHGV